MTFRGVFPILVTPFNEDYEIDFSSLEDVLRFALNAGVHGVVVPVNASEFTSLSDIERFKIAETVTDLVSRQVPVIIGVSGVSTQHALEFARHAKKIGSDAVLAMPPYARKSSLPDIDDYFRKIAQACELPLFIQNYPAPIGYPMTVNFMAKLINEVNGIDYIKEEIPPAGHKITEIQQLCGGNLKGVMGGMGGRYLIDEYRRGACGTMPAVDVADILVKVWNNLEEGKESKARLIINQLLPLLAMEWIFGAPACKEVLYRRGILNTAIVRRVGYPVLDDFDQSELSDHLMNLESLFTIAQPRLKFETQRDNLKA